jgi:hypothetical protein
MEDLKILFASVFVSILLVAMLSMAVDYKFESKEKASQSLNIDHVLLYDDYSEDEVKDLISLSSLKKNEALSPSKKPKTKKTEDKIYEMSEVDLIPHYGSFCKGIRSKKCTTKNIHNFIRKEMDLTDIKDNPNSRTEFVSFIIEPNGKMSDIKYVRSEGDYCQDCPLLAVQTVAKMENWEPGIVNEKAVPVKLQIPITFELGTLAGL